MGSSIDRLTWQQEALVRPPNPRQHLYRACATACAIHTHAHVSAGRPRGSPWQADGYTVPPPFQPSDGAPDTSQAPPEGASSTNTSQPDVVEGFVRTNHTPFDHYRSNRPRYNGHGRRPPYGAHAGHAADGQAASDRPSASDGQAASDRPSAAEPSNQSGAVDHRSPPSTDAPLQDRAANAPAVEGFAPRQGAPADTNYLPYNPRYQYDNRYHSYNSRYHSYNSRYHSYNNRYPSYNRPPWRNTRGQPRSDTSDTHQHDPARAEQQPSEHTTEAAPPHTDDCHADAAAADQRSDAPLQTATSVEGFAPVVRAAPLRPLPRLITAQRSPRAKPARPAAAASEGACMSDTQRPAADSSEQYDSTSPRAGHVSQPEPGSQSASDACVLSPRRVKKKGPSRHRRDEEQAEEVAPPEPCVVCCEPMAVVSVGPCGHAQVCARCCLRLRLNYKDMRCPLCKAEQPEVVIE